MATVKPGSEFSSWTSIPQFSMDNKPNLANFLMAKFVSGSGLGNALDNIYGKKPLTDAKVPPVFGAPVPPTTNQGIPNAVAPTEKPPESPNKITGDSANTDVKSLVDSIVPQASLNSSGLGSDFSTFGDSGFLSNGASTLAGLGDSASLMALA